MGVEHTKWMPDGSCRLWCPECDYRAKHNLVTGINRLVVRHVETTGHRVQVYRSQWKAVEPQGVEDVS
jgi:hypothetical protein